MKYNEILDILSQSLWQFNQEPPSELLSIVNENSLHRLRIYQQNLFLGCYNRLSEDYIGLKRHLEENNFRFFVQKYVLERKITSSNINEFANLFVSFLDEIEEFHQDPLIPLLARLDGLSKEGQWNNETQISLPIGVFKYWSQLLQSDSKIESTEIDWNQFEVCQVIEKKGERFMRIFPQ